MHALLMNFSEAGEYIKAMRKAHWDAGHLFQDKDGNTKTYWGNWESYLNGNNLSVPVTTWIRTFTVLSS